MQRWFHYCDQRRDWIVVGYRETPHLPERARNDMLNADARSRVAFESLLLRGGKSGQMKVNDASMLAINIVVSGHAWPLRSWHLAKKYTLEEYAARQIDLVMESIGVKR